MSDRTLNWAFIVYPDSAPADWIQRLKDTYVRFAVSPLHNPANNKNNEGEKEKKLHYHVLIIYDSVKTYEQVVRTSQLVNGSFPIRLDSASGYYKYMVHMTEPDKEQFPDGFKDIKEYNGFNGEKYQEPEGKELDIIFKELQRFIIIHGITEYSDFLQEICDEQYGISDYYRIARQNTFFFNTFISSIRNKQKKCKIDQLAEKISAIESIIK